MSMNMSVNNQLFLMSLGFEFFQKYMQFHLIWIQKDPSDEAAKAWKKIVAVKNGSGKFWRDAGLVFDDDLQCWIYPYVKPLTKADCVTSEQKLAAARFGWTFEV